VASHTCEQCGANVPADEQFCPVCGNFIDPLARPTRSTSDTVITVSSDGNYEEFGLEDQPPPDETAEGETPEPPRTHSCPSCGALNPPNNRHCQECGARLSEKPLPTAPRPAVQATAGVRAALAISGLLFAVIIGAILFNIFTGDGPTGTTIAAVTTTTQTVAQLGPIEVLSSDCTPEGIGAFVCDNLTSGTDAEYQVSWEDLVEGEAIEIRLTFRQPMTITRVDWSNLEDITRFKQNYRARGILIDAQNALQPFPKELEDVPGTQTFGYAAVNANWITFTIESAYNAEVTDGNVFRELAIQEITIFGRPANPTG